MCIVCVEWQKGKMTKLEALNALAEFAIDPAQSDHGHYAEVLETIEEDASDEE